MNYKKLKRYGKLRNEQHAIEEKIRELEAGAERTADSVQASLIDWPYTKGHVKIEGLTEAGAAKITTEGAELRKKLRRIRAEQTKIERYCDGVADPVIANLLRYHIIRGFTWREASDKVFGFGRIRESTAMMMVLRYLKKQLKS